MEMRKQDVGCGEGGEQKRENKSEVRGISDLSSTHNSVFKPCAHNWRKKKVVVLFKLKGTKISEYF